jgi:hypothetical protein
MAQGKSSIYLSQVNRYQISATKVRKRIVCNSKTQRLHYHIIIIIIIIIIIFNYALQP